ncbi:MAG: Error-prone repair protein ImuA [Chitinophagaceae bacterium]
MPLSTADIVAQLQKEILALQGFKKTANNRVLQTGLGALKQAFPNKEFPLGAVHEFIAAGAEAAAATGGFVSSLLASLMGNDGASVWISKKRTIFPPALMSFGIAPEKVIFIELQKEKDQLWAMEEALKCEGLSAVIGEIPELNFTASRRLQLAVEQSRVTGFILRNNPKLLNTTACVTRWKITPLPAALPDGMPGVGFPRWQVDLLKVRNGKPGSWDMEFSGGRLRQVSKLVAVYVQQQKKTG